MAVVAQVGASLRELSTASGPLLWTCPQDELPGGSRGQVLMPWPNRIEDGSYRFGGRSGRAALDEPDNANAIHGLVRWLPWSALDRSEAEISLGCELFPQPGYPWRLRCEVTYRLESETSLVVELCATNLSAEPAPFGAGFHPYLDPGPLGVDSLRSLLVPANRRLVADDRGIPRSTEDSPSGSAFDFRSGRPLRGVRLDDCFTGLPSGWTVRVERQDGAVIELWAEEPFSYVMCYTADTLGGGDRRRALAVEPMTCPPNAFRSGESLIALQPGARFAARFGIREVRGP